MPTLRFADFSGGLYIPGTPESTDVDPGFAIPANALLKADNVEYLPSGGIRGRRGRSLYNAAPLAGALRLLHRHYPRPAVDNVEDQASLFDYTGQVTIEDEDSIGTITWGIGPTGMLPVRAVLPPGAISHYCLLYDLTALSVPIDVLVSGIEVELTRLQAGSAVAPLRDHSVKLSLAGVPSGLEHADTGTNWRGIYDIATYGGPADLWGLALTPALLNAGFGVAVAVENHSATDTASALLYRVKITVYFTRTVAPTFLVAHVNGAVQDYRTGSAGVFTAATGGTGLALSDYKPRAVSWPEKGKSFLFDGLNPTKSWDGVTVETVETGSLGIEPKRGPYAALYRSRLYATEPAEIGYSVYASDVNQETQWDPASHLACSDSQGGVIAGLAPFGDSLIILKSTNLWRWVGDPYTGGELVMYSERGCVAPDTVAVTPYGVIYMARDGLRLTDGEDGDGTDLSRSLRGLFSPRIGNVQYPTAVGVYYPKRDQYWLKLSPAATECYVLQRLLVDTEDGVKAILAWSVVPSLPMTAAGVWDAENDTGELYVGDGSGFVRLLDVGSTDEGVPIPPYLQTASRMFDRGRNLGQVYAVKPFFRGLKPVVGGLFYDESAGPALPAAGRDLPIASIQAPRATIVDMDQDGRTVSVILASGDSGPDFELHGIDLEYRPRGARQWST